MYVITGGSDGLGFALAKLLASNKQTVISLSRSEPKGKGIGHIACDLTNEASINAAAEALCGNREPLQALVNCAGVYSKQQLAEVTGAELARTFTTNVIGPILLTARLIDRIKADGADVVNVASTAGTKGNPSESTYSSSKWALRGFSQNLRLELQGTPCRVISFCPGGFQSKLFEKSPATDKPDTSAFMSTKEVAAFLLQIMLLPKNMEVSEVILNRK